MLVLAAQAVEGVLEDRHSPAPPLATIRCYRVKILSCILGATSHRFKHLRRGIHLAGPISATEGDKAISFGVALKRFLLAFRSTPMAI